LRAGDLILALNNVDVVNAKQFNDQVGKLDRKKNVALLVRRGDATQYVIVRPADR
jgi:serine protease Do